MENKCLSCKICNEAVISIDEFFQHNRVNHQEAIHIDCPFEECLRFFSNQKSMRNHILSHYISPKNTETISNFDSELSTNSTPLNQVYPEKTVNIASPSEIISELKLKLLKQILHLLADESVTKKNSFEVLQTSFLNYSVVFKQLVQSGCLSPSDNACFRDLEEFFSEAPNVLKSEHRLKRSLIEAGYYVESRNEIIHTEKKLIYVNGLPKMVDDDTIIKLFNVAEMLKKFFNLPNCARDILKYVDDLNKSCDGTVSNIIQSKLWKWHLSSCDQTASVRYLPIFVYFDDFEPLNALGSHAGAYKIGAVYMGLPFLPDDIASKLKYILPIALFFSEDRKNFGNKAVFAPVIKELNHLDSQGITVVHSILERIKFRVVLILGDNLGLNGILGFVECFSANYHCRFCKNIKHVMHKQVKENISVLRNEFNYKQDVLANNISATGVKEECVFNDLNGFEVTKNFSVDSLHDWLEGGLHVDLCNIISGLIKKGYFTLQELNHLMKTHYYGPCIKNKSIDDITTEMLDKDKIKCSGAEMETFFISFATIIGHKIPYDENEWKLYIKAREIYSIITAKLAVRGAPELLRNLIGEHHELFLICFPNKHFKAKHHLWVHYPSVVDMVGSVSRISCLRYEAYHKKFKNVSRMTTCRINLLTTFAHKIEYQFADLLLNFDTIECKMNFGPKENANYSFSANKYGFSMNLKSIFVTNWIEKGGVAVKKNCVIQTGIEPDDSPIFGLVNEIYIIDDTKIFFGCQALENLGFDRHFYAYSVVKCNEFYLCKFTYEFLDKVSYINETIHFKNVTF